MKVYWPSPVISVCLKWKLYHPAAIYAASHRFLIKLRHNGIDQVIYVSYHNIELIDDCLSIIASFIYEVAFKMILKKIYFYKTNLFYAIFMRPKTTDIDVLRIKAKSTSSILLKDKLWVCLISIITVTIWENWCLNPYNDHF